jgi:membrane-bound lytic murein transglycosylase B
MRIPGAFLAFAVSTSAAADQVRAPEVSIRPGPRESEVAVTASANLGFDRWIAGFRDRAMAEGIRTATLRRGLR